MPGRILGSSSVGCMTAKRGIMGTTDNTEMNHQKISTSQGQTPSRGARV